MVKAATPLMSIAALTVFLTACMQAQTAPSVQSFTLMNADTQQPVTGFNPVATGATVNLALLPTRNLNIRVNTNPVVVGSVRFAFAGTNRIENVAPYAMAGDLNGVYNKWTPPVGLFTLVATAYAGSNGSGAASAPVTLTLNVLNSASPGTTTTAVPVESSEILNNPGMGFADFHFGWGAPTLPLSQYPVTRVAYFRWTWAELEPQPGQFNFAMVDNILAQARARNQRLAFRIMPAIPAWLAAQGVKQIGPGGSSLIPDHNHPLFLSYHERLVQVFGQRYAGRADIDHVDVGSVGCWGEWNSSCCPAGQGATCSLLMPNETTRRAIVDWYYKYFRTTPLVALASGVGYANTLGMGWRADCFGDYGIFSPNWNHMVNLYPAIVQKPEVTNAWRTAPVQFEACGVMQDWYNRGFNIDLILQKGLEWHMSVFNGKNSAVPAAWRPKVDAWLKKIGYRFVLARLTHGNDVAPGGQFTFDATWVNRGVAPAYRAWPVSFRLRDAVGKVVAQWRSSANVRTMLPGSHTFQDVFTVPLTVPAGTYSLDVAILNESGTQAFVQLAISGKRADLWHAVSQVRVR
jgi:hypothetical protein